MKEAVRIIMGGALSVVIATIFLKIAVNYDDSVIDKVGETGKKRIEESVETTAYPEIKVVDPAENIEVYFGNTILYTGQRYSLAGIIYAVTNNGEYLNIEFSRVYNELTHAEVMIEGENGDIIFYIPGVYMVKMTVRDEDYEMRIPVSKRWSL